MKTQSLWLAGVAALVACKTATSEGMLTGYVEVDPIYVAAPSNGRLTEVSCARGTTVETGDMLFRLEDEQQTHALGEAQARLDQAKAQLRDMETGARPRELAVIRAQLAEAQVTLREAQREESRWRSLVEQGAAAEDRGDRASAELDAANARVRRIRSSLSASTLGGRDGAVSAASEGVRAAEAVVEQAKWNLAQRTTRAPSAGIVGDLFHREGEYLRAGAPMISLLSPAHRRVRFFVPQHQLSEIHEGTVVRVHVDGATPSVDAQVSYVAAEAEFTPPVIYSAHSREKLVFLVEATLPAEYGARAGQPVDVELP